MRYKVRLLIACGMLVAAATPGCDSNSNNAAQSASASASPTATQTAGDASSAASSQTTNAVATNSNGSGAHASPIANGDVSSAKSGRSALIADACALLTSDEIKVVQGEAFKEAKSSQRDDANFVVKQCFYTTPTFNKSVSLEVTQSDPNSSAKMSPREFWNENFRRATQEHEHEREREKERGRELARDKKGDREKGREEGEEDAPPKRISGIGDDAYLVNSRVGGALYVLKNNRFIRVSVGGAEDESLRLKKTRALAEKALAHL